MYVCVCACCVCFFFLSLSQNFDRWLTPSNVLRIAGAYLDSGSLLSSYPFLYPRRLLVYWDSIGEGIAVNGYSYGYPSGYVWFLDGDATRNWVQVIANALQAEVGAVCYGSQGWINTGAGNVPGIMGYATDSAATAPINQQAWSMYDAYTSRLDANGLLQPPPDMVLMGHGTNDLAYSPYDVFWAVTDWLGEIQAAAGPQAEIYLTIPFGQFNSYAITNSFNYYQASILSAPSPRLHLLDLASYHAQDGLQAVDPSVPTRQSADQVHPRAWRSMQLGGMIVDAIQNITRNPATCKTSSAYDAPAASPVVSTATAAGLVRVDDPAWFWSPYNW